MKKRRIELVHPWNVPEYNVWISMHARCSVNTLASWPRYGGRGIKVCKRWNDFQNFYEDMGPRPSKDFTIERKDNDGNYEPDNCIWATKTEQSRNRSICRIPLVRIDVVAYTLKQAAKKLGLSIVATRNLLKKAPYKKPGSKWVAGKAGRPPLYKSDEERLAARRKSKRQYNARQRRLAQEMRTKLAKT